MIVINCGGDPRIYRPAHMGQNPNFKDYIHRMAELNAAKSRMQLEEVKEADRSLVLTYDRIKAEKEIPKRGRTIDTRV